MSAQIDLSLSHFKNGHDITAYCMSGRTEVRMPHAAVGSRERKYLLDYEKVWLKCWRVM